jgi:acetylornithine deacetylase/succinyl-diaminopimelate desuccinylase-like protein
VTRTEAIGRSEAYFDDGSFQHELAKRVAVRTESAEPAKRPELYRYLSEILTPELAAMGFACVVHENPRLDGGPFLVATRHENDDLVAVMSYGHGDVVLGYDEQWREGLDLWQIVVEGDRWYGRGTADNKAQHTINLAAMRSVLEQRGHLGFNAVTRLVD